MTRFARARGSKASNERVPNEGTPWLVMKQQLEESLTKHKEPTEKTKSAKELLAAKQDVVCSENSQNTWAEFENNGIIEKQSNKGKANRKKSAKNSEEKNKSNRKALKRNINEIDSSVTEIKSKKFKKNENESDDKSRSKEGQPNNGKNNEIEAKADKVGKKRSKNGQNITQTKNNNNTNNVSNNVESHDEKDAFSKRQKRNMKKRKNANDNVSNTAKNNDHSNVQNNTISNENKGKGNNQATNGFNKNFATKSRDFRNIPKMFGAKKCDTQKTRKPPKIRDDKEHKRRKADLGPSKIMINGVEVEIVKFDGFPVKKEDADRLSDLKQKMVMKGIPKQEIDAAMKLERRKAEKALARIRRCVCFHCRKAGHNLSDCPELGSEQAGTGICFKCGSTEHTHFECKVAKPTEFRYATCFICREQGHIAKQCPDNPKGVYPQGGSCKICGDVTHLKKDCPDLIKEKEESAATVNTITNCNLEALEGNEKNPIEKDDKKTKKIVKF